MSLLARRLAFCQTPKPSEKRSVGHLVGVEGALPDAEPASGDESKDDKEHEGDKDKDPKGLSVPGVRVGRQKGGGEGGERTYRSS